MPLTDHDTRMLRGTLLGSALLLVAAWAVMWATDDLGGRWHSRLARLGILTPGLGATAVLLVVGRGRERGEERALSSLGVTRWRQHLGALLGGWLMGAAGLLLLLSPLTDVGSLFPQLIASADWQAEGALLVDQVSGLRVASDGALGIGEPATRVAAAVVPRGALVSLMFGVVPLALVLPPWAMLELSPWRRSWVVAATAIATIVGLHVVAAGYGLEAVLLITAVPAAMHAALHIATHRRLASG